MIYKAVIGFVIVFCVSFLVLGMINKKKNQKEKSQMETQIRQIISLPEPAHKSGTSIEETLLKRRSVRDYRKDPLELKEISQLLWAAQGITSEEGGRTAPSAGALYPLELYVVSGEIKTVPQGVYHYIPSDHSMELVTDGDKRKLLSAAALMQGSLQHAPAVIVIAAEYQRTTVKYMERGRRYVHMEAGHVAQNIYLQAVSLKLGTVCIGAFTDTLVRQILHLPKHEDPLYLMPVGKY